VTSQPVEVPPNEPPPDAERPAWLGSWVFLAIIAIVLLLAGVGLGAVGRSPATVRVTATVTVSAVVTAPVIVGSAATATTFGDGQYQVGVDIPAGNYHTDGGHDCYWERLSDMSGGFTAIIANSESNGPQTVRVLASDKGFSVKGGCLWALVP
jgi:hypothetical protein